MTHQSLGNPIAGNGVATKPTPNCYLCGSPGVVLYEGLTDLLFGVPGQWGFRRCSSVDCSLVWLDPMPLESDVGKLYDNYHTHAQIAPSSTIPHRVSHAIRDGYLQKRFGYRQGVGPRWYRLLAPLAYLHPYGSVYEEASAMFLPSPKPGNTILDVGCGNGYLLARMKSMGWQVEGTEIDPVAVEVAHGRGVPVRLGELRDLDFPPNHFDAIHVSHVVEHVYDPVGLMKECYRILKPDGTLVLLTPNTMSLAHRQFKADWRGLEPPRHLHVFNPQSMTRLLAKSGFNIQDIKVRTRATFALSLSAALRDQRLTRGFPVQTRGFRENATSFFLQSWEFMLLLVNPVIGDEVVVMARK